MGLGEARDTDREILIRLEGKIDVMMVHHQSHERDITALKADVRRLDAERNQRMGMVTFVRGMYGVGGIAVGVVVAFLIRIQHV